MDEEYDVLAKVTAYCRNNDLEEQFNSEKLKRLNNLNLDEENQEQTKSVVNVPIKIGNTTSVVKESSQRTLLQANCSKSDVQTIDIENSFIEQKQTEYTDTEVINLTSSPIKISENDADTSFDFDNPEISVKVKWFGQIEIFKYRKHQKFDDLMNIFAKREKVNIGNVLLKINDQIIYPNDTPDNIDYKIFQFISGRIVQNGLASYSRKRNPDILAVKIQSNISKKHLEYSIKKTETFKILYIKCSEELKVPVQTIKLSIDGETLGLNTTPNDLDFEGDEVIDCFIN